MTSRQRFSLACFVLVLAIPVLVCSCIAVVVQGLAYFCAGLARRLFHPNIMLRSMVLRLELSKPPAPLPKVRSPRPGVERRRACGGPPLCYDWNCQREDGHP